MMDWSRIEKDLEVSRYGLIKLLPIISLKKMFSVMIVACVICHL